MTPDELRAHIDMLRAAGVSGPVEIGGIKLTIPAAVVETRSDGKAETPRSAKAKYDDLLFACTEGLPEDEEAAS